MAKKKDWIKITAITLAIIFLYLFLNMWSYANNLEQKSENDYIDLDNTLYTCEQAYKDLENSKIDLHNRWNNAYSSLKNCFENGMTTCSTSIPVLQ